MPEYIYINPHTKETVIVVQRMTEAHIFEKDGVKYERVWEAPLAAFDTQVDPWNSKQFVERSGKRKGTMNDLWTESAELSEKRKGNSNIDPIKEQNYDRYQKNVGKPHFDRVREKAAKNLDKMGVSVE